MTTNEKSQILFTQLISSLHGAALMQLGKMKNPVTGTVDRNIEQAEKTIEMLDLLKEKTKGNLNAEEESLITSVISQVKMNFVEEKSKGST